MRRVDRNASVSFGLSCLAALAVGLAPAPAEAFENQWQLGVSAGAATASHVSVGWGPSVSLEGVYGLSDAFDVEVVAQALLLARADNSQGTWSMGLLEAGVAYKLDVIEWVPRLGLHTGYYLAESDLRHARSRTLPHAGMLVGLAPGLDYAWSRSLGVGVTARFDSAVARSLAPSFMSVLLSAEYRWGW